MAVTTEHPSRLSASDRIWPLTNCYVDLWIELLHSWDIDPIPALAFTVTQDFEGDQFTFFKFPTADLETLFGTTVQELAIYDDLEARVACQLARSRVVLVEVDGYHLPDTRTVSYRIEHTKTTIGILELDATRGHCSYIHNRGIYTLGGEDYAAIFDQRESASVLFPYAEIVKRFDDPLVGCNREARSIELLSGHLRRRPRVNPVAAFRTVFPSHFDALVAGGMVAFHAYTFNVFRQFGANHELLGDYLAWLERDKMHDTSALVAACQTAAETAKALQFRLARMVNRKRFDACDESFDILEQNVEILTRGLATRFA